MTCCTISSQPQNPILFDEYFELGHEETVSPFITPDTRHWGANLTLKSAIIAAILLTLAFVLSFFPSVIPLSNLLLVVVYFIAGIPSLIEAIEDLLSLEINIDILMTLAAFSSVLIGSGMEGALLLVLFAISGSMEDFVTAKAKGDISSLHRLSPTKASVIENDGSLIERSIRDIEIGTLILVKSGQVVPLDGVVVDGTSSVNLVHLTGENMPVIKKVNDEVPAGGRNLEGALRIRVTRTSADSTLARIIQLVTQAQEERPLLQRWFDKLSKHYAITVILLSTLFALTLPWIINIPYFGVEGAIYRALAFLIAASPCALIIAIPIAYLSAIGVCARQGILLKGGITLDALARCRVLAFDKTGTLTSGDLQFLAIDGISETTSEELQNALAIAYALEKNAVHPIAKAIVGFGKAQQLPTINIKDFQSVPGYGLSAVLNDLPVYIGHPDYILSKLPSSFVEKLTNKVAECQARGELITVLLIGQKLYLLHFLDSIRPQVRSCLDELRQELKLRLVMLTGDHESSAKRVAQELGIDEFHADLRPEDKMHYVAQLADSEGLAMVGDGINDAPALARASVGICMGKVGSTTAVDAADVILLHDEIERLGWLIKKAHQTQSIVRQNLALATIAIVLASLPALGGFVPLWLAVVMHEGGTVLVGLNGLRLLRAQV